MPFPLIGVLGAVCAALGGYTLFWYHSLPADKRAEADRLAEEYAQELFGLTLDELVRDQLSRVHNLVRQRMAA